MNDSNLIIYTDGSASPNPGVIGSASHGYVYTDFCTDKHELYDNIFTDIGYVHIPDYDDKLHKLVNPLYIIEKSFSFSHEASNNFAEIFALKQILDWIIEKDISFKSILIYSDSSYVVNTVNDWITTWAKNNWVKSNGQVATDKELWVSILESMNKIRARGADLSIRWIKGHNNNLGNVLADFAANIARNNSLKGIYANNEVIVDFKEYEKCKPEFHPLLCFNNVLLNTTKVDKEYFLYKTDLPDNLIGKANSNSSYAVVCLKEPVSIIDEIKQKQVDSRTYNSMTLLKLDKIKQKKYYPRLKNSCAIALNNKGNSNSLIFYNKETICQEINPPGLLVRAVDHYNFLLDIMSDVKMNKPDIIKIDITNEFYTTEVDKKDKIKTILKPEFGVGYKNITLVENIKDKYVKIPLVLGIDLPNRNVLKNIETDDPKIYLTLWQISEESFGYCIYIETKDSSSVWSNMSSAKLFIKD